MANFFDDKDIVEDSGSFFDEADVMEDVQEEEVQLEPVASDELDISTLESIGRGAAQGATLGFADELTGAAEAAYETVTGEDKLKDLIKNYEKYRDESRQAYDEAREANKASYIAAEIGGGILPSILSGGAANVAKGASLGAKVLAGAKVGASQGAISGAGYSEAEEIPELVEDVATGTLLGGATGAAVPLAGKALKSGADTVKKATKAAGKKITDLQSMKDLIDTYQYSKAGKGVVGTSNREAILEESNKVVKEKLIPLINSEGEKAGKAIGKVLKKVDDLVGKKDISKELGNIEKEVKHMTEKGVIVTEEGKKALKELTEQLGLLKKQKVSVTPTKNVKSGVDKAVQSIQDKMNVAKAKAAEVGEPINFTEPKIDLDNGTVTVFETVSGKPIVSKIGSGEFTPVKTGVSADYQPATVQDLTTIKQGLFDIMDSAKEGTKLAKKPLGRAYGKVSDIIKETAEEADLKGALERGNEQFGLVQKIKNMLPKNLDDTAQGELDIANYIRQVEQSGAGGDTKRQAFKLLEERLTQLNPEKAKQLIPQIKEVSRRYDLATKAGTPGIWGLESLRSRIMEVSHAAGAGARNLSKAVQPVVAAKKVITEMTDEQLSKVGQDLVKSQNKGLQTIGNRLVEAGQLEGPAKQQLLWSISQSPAMREFIKRQAAETEEMERSIFDIESENLQQEVDRPDAPESASLLREPSSIANTDEALDFITKNLEGGYQDNANDTGNFLDGELIGTNHGITPKAYMNFYGTKPTVEDMKNLTQEQAKEIYQRDYIETPKFDQVQDSNLQASLIDFGIHSGPVKAIKTLQELVGVEADGRIGPNTLAAIEAYEGDLNADLNEARRGFLEGLDNESFGRGWQNRMDKLGQATQEVSADGQDIASLEDSIDRTNQMMSSGDSEPVDQLEALLEKINMLQLPEETIDELENDAVTMNSYQQGLELKDKIRKLIQS